MNIKDETVKVVARFHEQGSVLRGDAEGFCDGFEIEIQIESDEPETEIRELIRLARRMCFTEKALLQPTTIQLNSRLNGEDLTAV